jgi:hypothetical protein
MVYRRRRGLLRDSPSAFDRTKGRLLDLILVAFIIGLAIKGIAAVLEWLRG